MRVKGAGRLWRKASTRRRHKRIRRTGC